MKTDLSHLPEPKKAELKQIIASLIPRYSEIEMIVLFGSYARGNYVEDKYIEQGITYEYKSDYDLLVILSNNSKADAVTYTENITAKIDELELPTPVNPIFHGIEFVNHELQEGNYFFNDIKELGILLFTTNRYQLAEPRELSPVEIKTRAQEDFDQWFSSAVRFYEFFEVAFQKQYWSEAAFQLHQSTERYYNAIQLVYTGYKPKTHDLKILGKLANSFDLRFAKVFPKATELEMKRFILLRKAYVDARYKKNYKITQEDLQYLGERVTLLKQLTDDICKQKIESFTK